jgi:RimJ/RimL family protein N-acetyltransferase
LNLQNQKQWFDNFVVKNHRTLMFGIVNLMNEELIGVCGLCYIDWVNRNADLSIYFGKDDIYIDTGPDGFAWDTLDTMLEYGFNRLNLHKVWTEIYDFDNKKHELYRKYGLKVDGVLRDNYFYDGVYQNSHIYSLLASEWKK